MVVKLFWGKATQTFWRVGNFLGWLSDKILTGKWDGKILLNGLGANYFWGWGGNNCFGMG